MKTKEQLERQSTKRSCTSCRLKLSSCSTWTGIKEEKTVSGWDLNKFGESCREYKDYSF